MTATEPVTPADAALAGFLQSIELAVVDAYDKVTPFLSDTTKPIAAKFQGHHKDYAGALAKQAGTSAAKVPNQALTLVLGQSLQAVVDEKGAITVAFGFENQVTETYAFTLTTLTSPDVVGLVATTLPVLAAHAAILGASVGLATTALFPNSATEGNAVGDGTDTKLGFDPASFPAS